MSNLNEVRYIKREKVLERELNGDSVISCTILVLQQNFSDIPSIPNWVDVPTEIEIK